MIITKLHDFKFLYDKESIISLDLETKGTDYHEGAIIMGVGFYLPLADKSIYVPFYNYDMELEKVVIHSDTELELIEYISSTLKTKKIICHNALFDIGFLRHKGVDCKPYWCTRVGWHLISPEDKKESRGYGLDAGIENILGMTSHKKNFSEHIELRGGSVKNGDHYMADLPVMAKYCEDDCKYTYLLYQVQLPALEGMDAIEFMNDLVLKSHGLIWRQQADGIYFDTDLAVKYKGKLDRVLGYLERRLFRTYSEEIEKIRFNLTQRKVIKANYKRQETGDAYLNNKDKWVVFNFGSDDHLRELFVLLGIDIKERTEKTKKVSLAGEVLVKYVGSHRIIATLVDMLEIRTRAKFIPQYLSVVKNNIYRPDMDLCGTASGRLAGYSPNILAINRRDKGFMKCFKAREGNVMVQFDFCLHPDAEYLTERGWVKILDLLDTDKVWQVERDSLAGSWVKPSRIIKRHYEGTMYNYQSVRGNLSVTENHRMLWGGPNSTARPNRYKFRKDSLAQEGKSSAGHCMILHGEGSNTYSDWSEKDIWIACMLQADGSIQSKDTYRIRVAKTRKREKVRELLGRDGSMIYTQDAYLDAERWNNIKFDNPLLKDKFLNVDLIGSNQIDTLVEALAFWDGCYQYKYILWSCTVKEQVEKIQAKLVREGYEARLSCKEAQKSPKHNKLYRLKIRKNRRLRISSEGKGYVKKAYKGMVGCVTVPTGYILIRNEGQTFVTGNCQAEPRVEAAFTLDEELRDIILEKRDMYLELIKHIFPEKSHLYNPKDIEGSKKRLAKERAILKTVRLGIGYGMKAPLLASKIGSTVEEAHRIFRAYWNARHKAKTLENNLVHAYSINGYASNLFMRPIIIGNLKDIVNRLIQSSAHDTLTYTTLLLTENLKKCGIHYYSILPDIHDEAIFEVAKEDIDNFIQVLYDTIDQLNADLDLFVPFEIDHKIVNNFSELK